MGAYECAVIEEGTRDELVREFLRARTDVYDLRKALEEVIPYMECIDLPCVGAAGAAARAREVLARE